MDISFNSIFFKTGIILLFLSVCYNMMEPVMGMFPQRDSGCFLYIGQNWLKGMIPYKDMWDHKGPLLYLLNAAGIFIKGMKGVMLLQVLLTSLGFYYLFSTMRRYINQPAALLIAISGLLMLFFLHQSGNQTEQWGIFFQGLSLFFFYRVYDRKGVERNSWMGIGFLMACSFLLRPNQVSLWIAIGICELCALIIKKQSAKIFFFKLIYGLLGFLLPIVLFSIYFLYHHAFDEMTDCLFTYNFIYTRNSNSPLFENIIFGIKSIPSIWIILACMAVNIGLYIVMKADRRQWRLFLFAAGWLALEVVLSAIGGAGHLHYYVQWILPLLLVFCSFIYSLKLITANRQHLIYSQLAGALVLLGLLYFPFKESRNAQMDNTNEYKDKSMYREKIVETILSKTDDSDYVLVWGMVDGINFMAERRSPTRYFYPYALDTRGYTNEGRIKEFIEEIKVHQPKYIIDFSRMERFPSVFPTYRDSFYRAKPEMKGLIPPNINEFYEYIRENYESDDGKGSIEGSALILMRLDRKV